MTIYVQLHFLGPSFWNFGPKIMLIACTSFVFDYTSSPVVYTSTLPSSALFYFCGGKCEPTTWNFRSKIIPIDFTWLYLKSCCLYFNDSSSSILYTYMGVEKCLTIRYLQFQLKFVPVFVTSLISDRTSSLSCLISLIWFMYYIVSFGRFGQLY